MFKVTNGNSKLGGSIGAINLPALKTCREDAPCRKLCYVKKGNFTFKHVKACYENNLAEYQNNPQQAERDILSQLPLIGMVRWHASGDIIDMNYLKMMVRIAKAAKGVKFMCFTKKYELVNEYLSGGEKIPTNLKIIFSGWYGLTMDNPFNLPTAYIKLNKQDDERIKKSAMECSGQCTACGGKCWTMKKGQQVLFHQH